MIQLEIACNSLHSCQAAKAGGAQRIELFENLADGGCTPSAGSIKISQTLGLPIYVMIRPRGGNFHYSNAEIDAMIHDIHLCKSIGTAGIVFGCLDQHGNVDKTLNKLLLNHWGGKATFHRAIDRSSNYQQSIKDIIDLGFERILSSGAADHVEQGLDTLKHAIANYGHLIDIMPGAGVSHLNAQHIIQTTQCKSLHATCKHSSSYHGIGTSKDHETHTDLALVNALVKAIG